MYCTYSLYRRKHTIVHFCIYVTDNIYEARNRILGIKEPAIIADIPLSYFPSQNCSKIDAPPTISVQPSPSLISPTWQYSSPSFNQPSPFFGINPHPQFMYNVMHGSIGGSSG